MDVCCVKVIKEVNQLQFVRAMYRLLLHGTDADVLTLSVVVLHDRRLKCSRLLLESILASRD